MAVGQSKALAEADMKQAERSVAWLAAQRRRADPKHSPLLKENAPFVEQETALAYRKKVQALEIEGEQLAAQWNGATRRKDLSANATPSAEQAARDNLATFAKVTGKTFPADAVDTFVRALSGSTGWRVGPSSTEGVNRAA